MPRQRKAISSGRPAAQTPTLQDEQLRLVFAHLTEARDIIGCSAVCKTWSQAIASTRITRLGITHCGGKQEALAQVRWLQSLQKTERLKDLRKARLKRSNFDTSQANPSILSQGFTILAGACNLHTAVLEGPFCFSDAVALLPTSLSILDLWPNSAPSTVYLSDFSRLTKLEKLQVAVGSYASCADNISFEINACLSGLKMLILCDTLRCSKAVGHGLAQCLPQVQQLRLCITASEVGLQLAETIMANLTLQKLKVVLWTASMA